MPGHLHWHIVPRWFGDSDFMTAARAARGLEQSLEALYGLLVAKIKS